MYLDGVDIGLGKVVITDSKAEIKGVPVNTNCVYIYDEKDEHRFNFWTMQEYQKFNELELNKKVDVLDLIDDYDIDFASNEGFTINSRENAEVFFTRIDTDKYIVNAEIYDLEDCLFGNMDPHHNLKLEAIIDFNEHHKDKED